MTKLSEWLEKKTSNKSYVINTGILIAGVLAVGAVKQHNRTADYSTELAKAAVAMERADTLAQEQIRMFPVHYEQMNTLIKEGKIEEARQFTREFMKHVSAVRKELPNAMQFEIARAVSVDGAKPNLHEAISALGPALLSKDQETFEHAVTRLYVAIESEKMPSASDDIKSHVSTASVDFEPMSMRR